MAGVVALRAERDDLAAIYDRLRDHRGAAGWWPAETPFEVCVGAILVQNTAWPNAEKALAALRDAGRLSYAGLAGIDEGALAALIRSSGCYNVKARRLAAFVAFLGREYGGRVEAMSVADPQALRRQLID